MPAKKRTAKTPARRKNPAAAEEPTGQKAYLAKRDTAIEKLFLLEGLDAGEIAERLVANHTIETKDATGESALRLVRGVIARIRKRIDQQRDGDADETVAPNEFDAMSRRLNRLRREYVRQEMIAAGEPDDDGRDSTVTVTVDTPNGPVVSVRPKWPAGVRQKASRDAAKLAEDIAKLELEIAAKRAAMKFAAEDAAEGGLLIIESDKSIAELIEQNLGVN